jgi:8-oxo-dGTP pyrophosphatase MutT (NUDIX family)
MNIREAARGIILNPQGEILLIKMKADSSKSNQRGFSHFWLTPGGKVESSESHEEALAREIKEETGIEDFLIGEFLFTNELDVTWDNVPTHIINRHYLVRSEKITPTMDYLIDYEKELVLGYKWWPIEELKKTTEMVFPENLTSYLS